MKTYQSHNYIECIDAYEEPLDVEDWKECPNCGLKPRIWIFDNGRSTACGCWESRYDHFSIRAESIISVAKRNNGSVVDYDRDELLTNWNHWCDTKEIIELEEGKW